jgi:surfactin synthase thioesterase subunit
MLKDPKLTPLKLFVVPKPVTHPRLRIFCFPFAGGGANVYMPWVARMRDDVEMVLIQPPGRGARMLEPPHEQMDAFVDELAQHAGYFTETPYVFFGHSLGSRVAFELSLLLQSLGMALPEYFIASGSRAPHLPNEKRWVHDLPHAEFLEELASLNGTPREVLENKELMELLVPVLRADFKIADTYRAKAVKMPFPILVLNGRDDDGITPDQISAWQDLTGSDYASIELPGDHFFIIEYGDRVVPIVSSVLEKVVNKKHIV